MIQQYAKKARALTCPTIYVDSLNLFNDTVVIAVTFPSVLQPSTTYYLSKRRGSIREMLIYKRKAVYVNIIYGNIVQWKTRTHNSLAAL